MEAFAFQVLYQRVKAKDCKSGLIIFVTWILST